MLNFKFRAIGDEVGGLCSVMLCPYLITFVDLQLIDTELTQALM